MQLGSLPFDAESDTPDGRDGALCTDTIKRSPKTGQIRDVFLPIFKIYKK